MPERFREIIEVQSESVDDAIDTADAVVLETVLFALIDSIRAFGFSRSRFRRLLTEGNAELAAIDPDGSLRAEVLATGEGVLALLGRRLGPEAAIEDLPAVEGGTVSAQRALSVPDR